MRVLLVIETPEDDDLHWTRIERALEEYSDQVRANNTPPFRQNTSSRGSLGRDGGPNLFRTSMPGVSITELRVDLPFFRQVIGDRFPRARSAWGRFSGWWSRISA